MDRRNGGDPLAPPRPPKLLPRVHRPRAPEPTVMSSINSSSESVATTSTTTASAATTTTLATSSTTPQCTNNLSSSSSSNNRNNTNNNNNYNINHSSQQQTQQQQQQQQHLLHSITTTTTTTTTITTTSTTPGATTTTNLSNSNNNNNIAVISPATTAAIISNPTVNLSTATEFDDYQIHHLTFLPQRPSSLSRNSSHVSSASSSSASASITAANSFTRRRPLPPTPGSAVPLLTITGNSSSNNNFLSHFQSVEPAPPASPVTLAQPRPESERLTNEYVDTPLRNAQTTQQQQHHHHQQQQIQLQHATRSQHPAGQQDNGQTTTHHLLLLPQRELLRQQHQQHQHQIHSSTASMGIGMGLGLGGGGTTQSGSATTATANRLAAAAGSAAIAQTAATLTGGIDGTDGFLHSHNPHNHAQHHHHQHQQQHHHLLQQQHTHAVINSQITPTLATKCPQNIGSVIGEKFTPPPPPRGTGFATAAAAAAANAQPITQPITKQPASSTQQQQQHLPSKDVHSLDELFDLHHSTQAGAGSLNGQLGTPIIIGGDPSLLSPIVCPRCGRCRCEQCQSPRPLPQTWVCNKTCLCSAESIIDYVTCLCCAKALCYHCSCDNDMECDDASGTPCVDNPCSCGPYKRTQRWCWLGALSLVLPCLWCYWPMRGCVKLCELCYARFAGRGCRCQGIGSTSSMLPIVPLSVNGSGGMGGGGNGMQNGTTDGVGTGKKIDGSGHGRNECSAASRILRKGDLTPEKRLLDSSPDY